jgi:hypothetical protein
MFSIEGLSTALAVLAFLLACILAGFANERVKQVLPNFDRAILLIGFLFGAGSATRSIAMGPWSKSGRRRV